MAYEPRAYWEKRYAEQGAVTVGLAGMSAKQVKAQGDVFWSHVGPKMPQPCRRLLDLGCGTGRLAPYARPLVGEYWGVDICAEAIRMAEDANPGPGCRFTALADDRLPFPDGRFDCVAAVTVLQHIVDEAQFAIWCLEIARVLRPGGVAVVLDAMKSDARMCEHMCARQSDEVAAALRMGADSPVETVTAESKASHWCLSFVKSA